MAWIEIPIAGSGNGSYIKNGVLHESVNTENKMSSVKTSDLPYNFSNGCAVVFNDQIHILGGDDNEKAHYKLVDDNAWESCSTLPFDFRNGCAVVLNNEIHILGGTDSPTNHYKWDGIDWTDLGELPYTFVNGCAVVFNNEIHILGGEDNLKNHYKLDGADWLSCSTLPFDFRNGCSVVVDDEIHILGGTDSPTKHYKWNKYSWSIVSLLPINLVSGCCGIFDNKIHLVGPDASTTHYYVCNGYSWLSFVDLPSVENGCVISFNGKLHVLGGGNKEHYILSDLMISGRYTTMLMLKDMKIIGEDINYVYNSAVKNKKFVALSDGETIIVTSKSNVAFTVLS